MQGWLADLFECLVPEMARSLYLSMIVGGMVTDEAVDVTDEQIACVSEWVAGSDVPRIVRGMAGEDLAVIGEMLSAIIPCMPEIFLSEFLPDMGIDPDTLTDVERDCLLGWMVDNDWSNLVTAMLGGEFGVIGEFWSGLVDCVPGPVLAYFFDDFGVDLDALTDEERDCLEDWLIGFDWAAVIDAILSASSASDDDVSLSILSESFGLLACVPQLFEDDNGDDTGPDDHGDTADDATPAVVGEAVEGTIDYAHDTDLFVVELEGGMVYQIDVALVTLGDSELTVHDADGLVLAFNDDYDIFVGGASRITWKTPFTTSYYVEVTGFAFSTGSYTLTVEALDVSDDHGDTLNSRLQVVRLDEPIQGSIDYEGDLDLFALEADAGRMYQIDVVLDMLDDSVLAIYDAEGNELAFNDDFFKDGVAGSRITWEASSSGSYYVEVSGFDESMGSYTLTVTLYTGGESRVDREDTGPFRIGVMESLTGPGEIYGTVANQAKQMAVAEINAAGGINGRMLELVVEDEKCDAQHSITAYNNLTDVEGVKIILGTSCSGPMFVAAALAEGDGVVLLSGLATNPDIADEGDYIFRTAMSDAQVGIDTGNVLWADGVRTLATITEDSYYAEGVRRNSVAQFEKRGGAVVGEERYASDVTDFRSQLTKLLNENPDALHIAAQYEFTGGTIVKQARELGYDGPIYGEIVVIGTTALEIAGHAATGVKAIIAEIDPVNRKAQEVVANFKERYGYVTLRWYLASAYDNVYITAECLKRTNDDQDADGFRDCLYDITWSGAIGDGYSFDYRGEVTGVFHMVVEVLPVAERTESNQGYRVLGPAPKSAP